MALRQLHLPLVLLILVLNAQAQDVNWDVTYLLNRRYGVARADEDFPIRIHAPSDGTLYNVPAMKLFPEGLFANDTFFIHIMFKPRKEVLDTGMFLMAIRDPDNTLRFSLQVVHRSAYEIILTYNPVDSVEGEREVSLSVPWIETYWHLGVRLMPNQTEFYTSCTDIQEVPYHTAPTADILGVRLFRDGATFYALNSGLRSAPSYFTGLLKSFNFQATREALKQMCTKSEQPEGSGTDDVGLDIDPEFGNVLVTDDKPTTPDDIYKKEDEEEKPIPLHLKDKQGRYHIFTREETGKIVLYDKQSRDIDENIEEIQKDLITRSDGRIVAVNYDKKRQICNSPNAKR